MRYGMTSKKSLKLNEEKRFIGELNELKEGLRQLGIEYDKSVLERFCIYLEVLHNYKDKVHLLSHRDYAHIARRHFVTSLTALKYIKRFKYVCDVGAGAGFPSIPLRILLPDIDLTLFESRGKKVRFLNTLIDHLGLMHTRVVNGRAEDYKERKFEVVLLKAVGKIKKLVKTIEHLIEPQGIAIFYKTHRIEDELRAAAAVLEKKHFRIRTEKLFTPLENLPLALVILEKFQG